MTFPDLPRPPLDRDRLAAVLAQEQPWTELVILDEAGSTNAVAADRAPSTASGLVVVAEHQTSGRGRLDRVWVTPPRSAVTVSFLLRPAVPAERWLWLPLLAGVATVDAVRAAAGVEARLKWPNDVLVANRKLGGILVERLESGSGLGSAAVVGIGVNVSLSPGELPVAEATSLSIATGGPVDRTGVLAELLSAFGRAYTAWERAVGDPAEGLRGRYTALCSTLGSQVTAALPSGRTITGTATAIDREGMLVIDTPAGAETVAAGDVTHLRPVE